MKRLTPFLVGFLVGGLTVFGTLKYHIVRATDGYHVIPKTAAKFSGAYVDIRQFSIDDWQQRPDLALAISRHGDGDLMSAAARQSARESVRRWWAGDDP